MTSSYMYCILFAVLHGDIWSKDATLMLIPEAQLHVHKLDITYVCRGVGDSSNSTCTQRMTYTMYM